MKPAAYPHHLMLVEDSRDDEILSLRGLSKSGIPCNVTVQRDGASAVSALLDMPDPPSLVLLDYQLPKLNGLQVLTALRLNEKTRHMPVVMVSGSKSDDAMLECYRMGANSWVDKADDPTVYVDRLASIIRYWLTVNQPPIEGAMGRATEPLSDFEVRARLRRGQTQPMDYRGSSLPQAS